MANVHPIGQDPLVDPYKTGQRVPVSGDWKDQHGVVSYHEAHATFPPLHRP